MHFFDKKIFKSGIKPSWIASFLIAWNILDIAVHIAIKAEEPLRITGNIIGILACGFVILALPKKFNVYF